MDDEVFRALADPTRRALLDRLAEENGQSLKQLCVGLGMSRQSVSKHLAVLEAANVVTTLRQGRELLHHLNAEPINAIADRWMSKYDRGRAQVLAGLKQALEGQNMAENSEFVYVTYIRSTPEKVWRAITEPEFTKQYWGVEFRSDWKKGSPIVWDFQGLEVADPEQVVVESSPYERLAYTWHGLTPELVDTMGWDEDRRLRLAEDPRTTATFTIEPQDGGVVKLSLVHTGAPDSTMVKMVEQGWPVVLAGLKTLLETGSALKG
ncbi:metalloregulator ArsR/SmtB family transcription factor [Kineosporia sp. NBRC 101731]|uniref:ArsR/SmtB family transcription factor n=1 Tax=Kineosporia sp. NBRC 101731 TaxID=3032199 RepID=UPI0024A2ED6B|nr:metalloregulator ArsR/SmtB family transcription factor [Kineosporia sp. NBRC 101731]GLY31250.1 ArsR family transcriptional regulator [Kineosporia sp. NBRC 101731]